MKIYHAAASGIPCVVTPLLAIHLNWTHEREVLVAETPEDFAQQCVRLYTDAALWERLRVTAFERVMHDCDVGLFDRTVANICMKAQSYKTEM